MIDLSRSRLIVLTHPEITVDMRTVNFFSSNGMPLQNIVAANNNCSVIESRNRIFRDLVIGHESKYDWFIFMDRDNYPEHQHNTDAFLEESDAQVVGATYDADNPGAWLYPDQFHMGCVRIHSSALTDLTKPYFMFKYNEDGTNIEQCECDTLRQQFIQQGVKIARQGHVGHNSKRSWQGPSICSQ